MEFDAVHGAQELFNSISEYFRNLKKLNIIVAGKTGVGKSTLINSVFREKLADTGIGKPVTTHMRRITKEGLPLTIYDTRGFELGRDVQNEVKQEIIETITKGQASKDFSEAVHCLWYCISTATNRVEPEEIEWIRELSKANQVTQVPIIIVLTQTFNKKKAEEMRRLLINENLDVIQVIPVLAEDYEIDGLGVVKANGLDLLIRVMEEALPDRLRDTFQNVQQACLDEKIRHSQSVIAAAAVASVTESAVPIPLADCLMLIPTQITMITRITVIFGFDVSKSILTAVLSSSIGAGGATLLGKFAVTNILKLIPGAGSVAGGAVSSATAGAITAALGGMYLGVMVLIAKGEMSMDDLCTEKGKATMKELFKEQLTMSRK